MGDIFEKSQVPLLDEYDPATTFRPGVIDKLDLTTFNGDAVVQFTPDGREWRPASGLRITRGVSESLTGLFQTYRPGPFGFRMKRAAVGVAAVANVRAWLR